MDPSGELSGQVALVTGGARGIGRGIVLKLAQSGADVAINYLEREDAAHEVAD
jgi:3-oxoacyl-[acyl-carrier protein] reductase